MKLLLSNDTIKMHEQEAKMQGVPLDDIIKRETLISPNQTAVDYRNQKIEGNKASLEIRNSYGSFDTVLFIKEDGVWKIDQKSLLDMQEKEIEEENNRKFDEANQGRQPGHRLS